MATLDYVAYLALAELEDDILSSLRSEELRKLPNVDLMECQIEITWEMRFQLLEYLAETQVMLGLSPDAWALSVTIVDRYMSQRYVYAKLFQLLGCVSLWIAAKTCDSKRRLPTTATLAYLCGGIYPESMFNEMELHILSTLQWNVIAPIASDFIDLSVSNVAREIKSRASKFHSDDHHNISRMAHYIAECALYHNSTLSYRPSEIAASAVSLSTLVLDHNNNYNWPMINTENSSKECFDALVAVIGNPPRCCVQRYASDNEFPIPVRFDQFISKISGILDESPRTPYVSSTAWEDDCLSSPESLASCYTYMSSPQTPVSHDYSNNSQIMLSKADDKSTIYFQDGTHSVSQL